MSDPTRDALAELLREADLAWLAHRDASSLPPTQTSYEHAVNGTWTADGWLLPDGAGENASLNAALRNIAPELLAVVRAVDAWRHKHKPEAWLDVFAALEALEAKL